MKIACLRLLYYKTSCLVQYIFKHYIATQKILKIKRVVSNIFCTLFNKNKGKQSVPLMFKNINWYQQMF